MIVYYNFILKFIFHKIIQKKKNLICILICIKIFNYIHVYLCIYIYIFLCRLVTPQSILHYRVLDYCKFQKDVLIAEKNINLYDVLCNYGICENLELTIDLMRNRQHDLLASSSTANFVKVGELITILNGFQADAPQVPNPSRDASTSTTIQGIINKLILKTKIHDIICL